MSQALKVWQQLERYDPLQRRDGHGRWALTGFLDGSGAPFRYASGDGRGSLRLDIGSDAGDGFEGHTVHLERSAVEQLHADLTAAAAAGRRRQAAVDAHWERHGAGPAGGYEVIAEGSVIGDSADVHYRVELDDPDVGVQTYLAAVPHGSELTLDDQWGAERATAFDPGETRKLLQRLATASTAAIEGGHDVSSLAVELWRALEAWDPDRHPRGPGGRFIKALGGGGKERPSLADTVRGTAAGGQKRQRDDRGGMSVGDAVRAAARTSDTTGRPTQRSTGEHRAHGAHDVADEVDRALADAGVSEEVRRAVSGRARARADEHGPRPDSLPQPSAPPAVKKPALPVTSAARYTAGDKLDAEVHQQKVAAAKAAVLAALPQLETHAGAYVDLTRVRNHLGETHNRHIVDEAIRELEVSDQEFAAIPETLQLSLTTARRDAALRSGGQDRHLLTMGASHPSRGGQPGKPMQRDPRTGQEAARDMMRFGTDFALHPNKAADPNRAVRAATDAARRELADALMTAPSRTAARNALSGLTVRELRVLAGEMGATVGSKDTKAKLVDRLVAIPGRRLDRDAIDRMARGT